MIPRKAVPLKSSDESHFFASSRSRRQIKAKQKYCVSFLSVHSQLITTHTAMNIFCYVHRKLFLAFSERKAIIRENMLRLFRSVLLKRLFFFSLIGIREKCFHLTIFDNQEKVNKLNNLLLIWSDAARACARTLWFREKHSQSESHRLKYFCFFPFSPQFVLCPRISTLRLNNCNFTRALTLNLYQN